MVELKLEVKKLERRVTKVYPPMPAEICYNWFSSVAPPEIVDYICGNPVFPAGS